MTEAITVEAIRAAGMGDGGFAAQAAERVADPSSVQKFEAAMGVNTPQAVAEASPTPFLDQAASSWRTAQINHQGILHRIRALSELGASHTLSAPELVELQYEVMNLSFQQEIVTKVADKSSSAIQTLVRNQ